MARDIKSRRREREHYIRKFSAPIEQRLKQAGIKFEISGRPKHLYSIPNPERFKNYISVPKKNGYQSIHTTVVGPDGKMVEVQIRTRGMHEVAEKGVAAHWMYKENSPAVDQELQNWVIWVREIFENAAEGQVPAQQLMPHCPA